MLALFRVTSRSVPVSCVRLDLSPGVMSTAQLRLEVSYLWVCSCVVCTPRFVSMSLEYSRHMETNLGVHTSNCA